MPAQIPIGQGAPTAFAVKIAASLTVPDMTTVTAVSLKIKQSDGSIVTLPATIPASVPPGVDGVAAGGANPTTALLVALHVCATTDFTVVGPALVTALLTVPGGITQVRAYARTLILTDDFGQ